MNAIIINYQSQLKYQPQ